MEEKTDYLTGDQGDLQSWADSQRGNMVRMYEVFCHHCGRSDLVGFDDERDGAELEAVEIGWTQKNRNWLCPDHSSS